MEICDPVVDVDDLIAKITPEVRLTQAGLDAIIMCSEGICLASSH